MKAESRVNFLIYYRRSLTQSASWLMQRGSVVRFVIWAWNICNLWLSHCKKRGAGNRGVHLGFRLLPRTFVIDGEELPLGQFSAHWVWMMVFCCIYLSDIISQPPSSSQGFFPCQCPKRKATSAFDNSVQVLEQGTGDHNKQGMDCWHLAMKSRSKKHQCSSSRMPHRSVQVWELGMVIGAVDQGGEGGAKRNTHKETVLLLQM